MPRTALNDPIDGCYFCGSCNMLERHHIFGASNRGHSESDGLVVYLCHNCHNEPPNGVHYNKERADYLRRIGQIEFEKKYSHATFMGRYGRNYL